MEKREMATAAIRHLLLDIEQLGDTWRDIHAKWIDPNSGYGYVAAVIRSIKESFDHLVEDLQYITDNIDAFLADDVPRDEDVTP